MKNLWRYYPSTWPDWYYHFRGEIRWRLSNWWFWLRLPLCPRRCPICAGDGDQHHSFGGDVDVIPCDHCKGTGKVNHSKSGKKLWVLFK